MEQRRVAFVLMPFDSEFDEVYEGLVRPALDEAGFDVRRADSVLDQHNVMRDVVRGINTADLVVAEITTANPNVYYELGIAHALRKPTVMLTQAIESLPFDLRSYRAIAYSTHFVQAAELRARLKDIAQGLHNGTLQFGNPVSDFLDQASTSSAPTHADARVDSVELEEEQTEVGSGEGFLDSLGAIETSIAAMNELMEQAAEATYEIGEKMLRRTEQMEGIDFEAPGAVLRAQKITGSAARDMREYASRVEAVVDPLEFEADRFSTATWNYASSLNENDPAHQQVLREVVETIDLLVVGARESREQLQEFRSSIAAIHGVTRDLDSASGAVTKRLSRLAGVLESVEASAEKVRLLVTEKLEASDSGTQSPT